jgi:hypothetical protein
VSAKWVRSQEWDRQHLTGALAPVRWLVHSFSSITLAIIFLVLVAVYGVLASVPIGLIALLPTYILYAVTLLVTVAIVAGLPVWGWWRATPSRSFAVRFAVSLIVFILLALVAVWGWYSVAWPVLRYDESSHSGLRLFADFVDRYKAVSVRRTPALEMTELEFYGWWPLKLLLLLFVVNMTVATLRRIEFNLPNLGVLTVHTGIVTLGLGAAAYSTAKQEGDVLLLAGTPDASGTPTVGPMETGFFDNTRVVLRVSQERTVEERVKLNLPSELGADQRRLFGLPRYNDYNLGAVTTLDVHPTFGDDGRTLSITVPSTNRDAAGLVDPDINLRIVGYAAAAELVPGWRQVDPVPGVAALDQPVRYVEMRTSLDRNQQPLPEGKDRLVQTMGFMPTVPAERVVQISTAIGIEYTRNLSEERWADLTADIPMPADKVPAGGLIVRIPSQNIARIFPVQPGSKIEVGGYTIEFTSISPRPPFPIITPGYEGAGTSVAVVHITPPAPAEAAGEAAAKAFDRYLYSRFPELTQDLSATERNAAGMPVRTAPSKDIQVVFVDATMVQVHMDERPDGTVRGFIRLPLPRGASVIRTDPLKAGDSLAVGPQLSLKLGEKVPSVERASVPRPITGPEREKELGTHKQAAIAVEVSINGKPWTSTVWLPFQLYTTERVGAGPTRVNLPDGRVIELSFGRLWHLLPGLGLELADFSMTPYPHSEQPQDFRSDLIVTKFNSAGEPVATEKRFTSLNEPLLESPFIWDGGRSSFVNAKAWIGSLLGDTRFKFSQNGWDNTGWTETKARAERGELKRPLGRFTILGVGNNPGIKIIALGAVLTCAGIPWAFYIKPWMIKRRKLALAATAAGGKPTARPMKAPVPASPAAMEVKP